MLWVQSLWVLKEKMNEEQLREANETIQMVTAQPLELYRSNR